MLGLTILAALAISIGALGFTLMQRVSEERRARDAALIVERAARAAIVGGSPQTLTISIPSGYVMKFVENKIAIDNWLTPVEGLVLRFADNSPVLGAGHHRITIKLEGSKIVVES